jgi:hypothetical protein
MFGNKSKPSRVYSYGAKAPDPLEAAQEQMRLAHVYRNKLVEQELARRGRVEDVIRELFPDLKLLADAIAEAGRRLSDLRTRIKAANAQARRRPAGPSDRTAVKELVNTLQDLRARRESRRAAAIAHARVGRLDGDRWTGAAGRA